MTVEVNPVRTRCGADAGGLSCVYCYEGTLRDAYKNEDGGAIKHELIQQKLEKACGKDGFALFGGEPLLASMEDLEKLFAFGLKKYGKNGIQTSGRPITPEHLDLFDKYRVHVGFSIDGPEELNDARWAGSTEETRKATEHSNAMLKEILSRRRGGASVICTLHRKNASDQRIGQLEDWFIGLDKAGMTSARLHVLEHDGPVKWLALSHDENLAALKRLHRLDTRRLKGYSFDIFTDMVKLLRNPEEQVSCVWMGCDPWSTPAVVGFNPDGEAALCQRVYKDDREWTPAPHSRIRQALLATTPIADGGCQGCRFLTMCKGQCPGTAMNEDWRNRSRDCALWFALFGYLEEAMLDLGELPASLDEKKRRAVEEKMLAQWRGVPSQGCHSDVKHGDRPGHSDSNYADHDNYSDHTDLGFLKGGERVKK